MYYILHISRCRWRHPMAHPVFGNGIWKGNTSIVFASLWKFTLPETNIAMENPQFWWYLLGKMGFSWAMLVSGRVTLRFCGIATNELQSNMCLCLWARLRKNLVYQNFTNGETLSVSWHGMKYRKIIWHHISKSNHCFVYFLYFQYVGTNRCTVGMAKWNNISPTADFPEIAGVPFPLLFATIWGEKQFRNPFTVGFFIHLQFSRNHWIICWHFFGRQMMGPAPHLPIGRC